MANGHGGYRRPNNPAPVSGPGAKSKRTDGQQPTRALPDAKYGEGKAFEEAQAAAPMSESTGGQSAAPAIPGVDTSGLTPLSAPSGRPDEPITAGAAFGEGAGPTGPMPGQLTPEQRDRLSSYMPYLVQAASRPDADPFTKQLVRTLRAQL